MVGGQAPLGAYAPWSLHAAKVMWRFG